MVAVLITRFARSYNVFTPMNDDQIMEFAEELVVDYWDYTFEDFVSFFDRAGKNHFGIVTNRVDKGIILQMFSKYQDERLNAIITQRETEHAERKSLNSENYSTEGAFGIEDILKVLRQEATVEEVVAAKKNPPPAVQASPEDAARQADVLARRVEFFVEEIMRTRQAGPRVNDPFYLEHKDAVDALLKERRAAAITPTYGKHK